MEWKQFLVEYVIPAVAAPLLSLLGWLLLKAIDALKRWSSTQKHMQAVGICCDAVAAAWQSKIRPSLAKKIADGKVSDAEWAEFKAEVVTVARDIAMERLTALRGFAPAAIGVWVATQVEVALGEAFGRAFPGGETDPLANTPASDQ